MREMNGKIFLLWIYLISYEYRIILKHLHISHGFWYDSLAL